MFPSWGGLTMSRSKIVILTGAGLSAESGVATFRDPDGVWAKFNLEDVATPEGFARDPAKVQDFYNMRRRQMLGEMDAGVLAEAPRRRVFD